MEIMGIRSSDLENTPGKALGVQSKARGASAERSCIRGVLLPARQCGKL